MRKALLQNEVPTVRFAKVQSISEIENLPKMEYPLIVKPTDRSGSRAITKIYKKEELKEAIQIALDNSFEKKAIVEEYIEGKEYLSLH